MPQVKRGYSTEFKTEVLAYMTSMGKSLRETADHFGVTTTTLRDWRRRLRRENRELQMRCEILKKTVGIFSALDPSAASRSKP